jgi:hypothetical protein
LFPHFVRSGSYCDSCIELIHVDNNNRTGKFCEAAKKAVLNGIQSMPRG